MHQRARRADIVADAAYAIITQPKERFSYPSAVMRGLSSEDVCVGCRGVFAIDEVVLQAQGIKDFRRYAFDGVGRDLEVDLFVDDTQPYSIPPMTRVLAVDVSSKL